VDETVLDLVAHRSLKTPTAVAEFIVQHNMMFETEILEMAAAVKQLAGTTIKSEQTRLDQTLATTRWISLQLAGNARGRLELTESRIPLLTKHFLKKQHLALDQAAGYCEALHPDNILRRGFSITTSNGNIVTDPAQLQPGSPLETRVKGGVVKSVVE
jgi:exodeoxyribonuclease VII large subunit